MLKSDLKTTSRWLEVVTMCGGLSAPQYFPMWRWVTVGPSNRATKSKLHPSLFSSWKSKKTKVTTLLLDTWMDQEQSALLLYSWG